MIHYDSTQDILQGYLNNTIRTFNEMLLPMNGSAEIKTCLDLGFPHDIIRIAGGFATGVYVKWSSEVPVIPVDTCVNVCSCTFFEIDDDITSIFNSLTFSELNHKLEQGIYVSNFHRGNHFISYLQSTKSGKRYLLLHSSASEFKNNFNGLYPVKGNWFYDNIKTFYYKNNYIRYIDGRNAEVFYHLAENLLKFNENRHEFIAHQLLGDKKIKNISHYHHYFMPDNSSVIMGSHIVTSGQTTPILSVPGANIYMVKFNFSKSEDLYIDKTRFITPHGWGKRHKSSPKIVLDAAKKKFKLDDIIYNVEFGESLRSHPMLELRNFVTDSEKCVQGYFEYLGKNYDYEIVDEMKQIVSYNKAGVIKW